MDDNSQKLDQLVRTDNRNSSEPSNGDILQRLEMMETQHVDIRKTVNNNFEQLKELQKDTREIISFFNTMEEGFKILGYLSKLAKWITIIVVMLGSIFGVYTQVKTGKPPSVD